MNDYLILLATDYTDTVDAFIGGPSVTECDSYIVTAAPNESKAKAFLVKTLRARHHSAMCLANPFELLRASVYRPYLDGDIEGWPRESVLIYEVTA